MVLWIMNLVISVRLQHENRAGRAYDWLGPDSEACSTKFLFSPFKHPPSLFDLKIIKSTWLPISWPGIAMQATGYYLLLPFSISPPSTLESCLRQSFACIVESLTTSLYQKDFTVRLRNIPRGAGVQQHKGLPIRTQP